jgi:phosphate transport system protein
MTIGSRDIKVNNIKKQIVEMADLVEKLICDSIISLRNHDLELADKVIKGDVEIDEMQKSIEEQCIKFIAAEQPLATDLRKVMAASKIVTDLERMADYAVDICKTTKRVAEKIDSFKKSSEMLWEMDKDVRAMFKLAMGAYINEDEKTAYEICKKDDEIDSACKLLFSTFIEDNTSEQDLTEKKLRLLFVIKYLERIGDRVTNICESTIYLKSGKYVDLNE